MLPHTGPSPLLAAPPPCLLQEAEEELSPYRQMLLDTRMSLKRVVADDGPPMPPEDSHPGSTFLKNAREALKSVAGKPGQAEAEVKEEGAEVKAQPQPSQKPPSNLIPAGSSESPRLFSESDELHRKILEKWMAKRKAFRAQNGLPEPQPSRIDLTATPEEAKRMWDRLVAKVAARRAIHGPLPTIRIYLLRWP